MQTDAKLDDTFLEILIAYTFFVEPTFDIELVRDVLRVELYMPVATTFVDWFAGLFEMRVDVNIESIWDD